MPSFIRRHKWLTTILSIVFIGLPQYIDSVWSLAEKISGRQLAMPDIMWAYWITVPLGITMFCVAIWVIKSNKSSDKQSKDVSKITERILIQIHKRMLGLKDKAARQYYLNRSFKEFLDLLNDLMGTMGKNAGLEDIRKRLGGKKLSKDRGKKRAQIDNLLDQVKPTLPMDWSLDALVKFVNKFNRLAQTPNK